MADSASALLGSLRLPGSPEPQAFGRLLIAERHPDIRSGPAATVPAESQLSATKVLVEGAAGHWNYREDDDYYYSQPGSLFRPMTPAQQQGLFDNTARAMGDAPDGIKLRHVGNCARADPAYGAGVAKALRQ